MLKGVAIPRKLIGCIEQAICAMGRRFVGTQHSTFTAYIVRLRGYLDAPDKRTYFHNQQWSADDAQNDARQWESRELGRGSRRGFHRGQNYMEEDPRLWEDTLGVAYPPDARATEAH